MSSRFVSGGTIGHEAPSSDDVAPQTVGRPQGSHNAEWEAVQKELEAERTRREEARIKAAHGEEKSLYDVLQANKAAKEAAFQEANRLRNQFRALDDDEVDFLDEVRSKQRREEHERKKELQEGVRAFREAQQKGTTKSSLEGEKTGEEVGEDGGGEGQQQDFDEPGQSWGVGRKRKRREKEGLGVLRKKTESAKGKEATEQGDEKEDKVDEEGRVSVKSSMDEEQKKPEPAKEHKKSALGLVDYGSDSDED